MRQGQNQGNRNRNRNRPRHRSTGGSSSNNSGGNSANKVFDSNGPDVKLRGTSQTVAEKYMQLGRDAQSSGDSVSAESYYQHAEHYYRMWAANQPAGASLLMSRKLGEEEFEEDGEGGEDEAAEGQVGDSVAAEGAETTEASLNEGQEGQPRQPNNNNRNNNNNNNRERFKPRWQQRRDRPPYQAEGGPDQNQQAPQQDGQQAPTAAEHVSAPASDQWEAPSFLQRPTPAAAPEMASEDAVATEPARRVPRPRRERTEPIATTAEEAPHDNT